MKKIFTWLFNKAQKLTDPKFSVRKIVKNGKTEWLPMVRGKGLFAGWLPIVKIYNRYETMPYEVTGGLSELECIDHIEGYQKQLLEDQSDEVTVDYVDPKELKVLVDWQRRSLQ